MNEQQQQPVTERQHLEKDQQQLGNDLY
jgi:hypothetical protein